MAGSPDAILKDIKGKLTEISETLDDGRRIIYIDYPLHRNIGDLLINTGTEAFFREHGHTVKRRYNLYDLPAQIPDVDADDVFVFHGGGNLGDLYPEHLDAMSSVLRRFPNNQVVQFPQTVYFKNDGERERRCAELRAHPRTTVFVRDRRSLDALQEFDVPRVRLIPDMAHQLYGSLIAQPSTPTKDSLYFFRKDVEGGSLPARISRERDSSVDWDDCIHLPDRLACAFFIRATRWTKSMGHAVDVHRGWYHYRDNMIQSGIQLLSEPATIYTNRLHAMLLGLLLGRQVFWFDNSYGKLSSYVGSWLQDVPTIRQLH